MWHQCSVGIFISRRILNVSGKRYLAPLAQPLEGLKKIIEFSSKFVDGKCIAENFKSSNQIDFISYACCNFCLANVAQNSITLRDQIIWSYSTRNMKYGIYSLSKLSKYYLVSSSTHSKGCPFFTFMGKIWYLWPRVPLPSTDKT